MTGTMLGADPDQLDELAAEMERSGETLRAAVPTISGALEATPWHGGDADSFRSEWSSTIAQHIEAGAQLLLDHASELRRNAEEQRQASSADGGHIGRSSDGADILDALAGTFRPLGEFFGGGLNAIADVGRGMAAVAEPATFQDVMTGQQPQPIDSDLAQMSNDVYDFSANGSSEGLPAGWQRVSAEELSALGIGAGDLDEGGVLDLGSGFKAGVYKDAEGHYVLAFAGTDMTSVTDWATNAEQAFGVDTKQYNQALALARKLKGAYGDNLVITGHSLGGGLASYAALGTDTQAVTFNAAGLSDDGLQQATGLDPAAARAQASHGQIRAYRVENDALTALQEGGIASDGLPDAVGNPITMRDPVGAPSTAATIFTAGWASNVHKGDMHTMGSVLDAMEKSPMTYDTTYTVIESDGREVEHNTTNEIDGGSLNRDYSMP